MWSLAVFVVDCDGVMVCIVVESGVSSVFFRSDDVDCGGVWCFVG